MSQFVVVQHVFAAFMLFVCGPQTLIILLSVRVGRRQRDVFGLGWGAL